MIDLHAIVSEETSKRNIDPLAVSAIITVESGWRTNTARYEKNFSYLFDVKRYAKLHRVTEATEISFQKTSWGLMHVMGGSARSVCYYTGWLPLLCDPGVGIRVGCDFFVKVCDQYTRLEDQFAAYNGGSVRLLADGRYRNQEYVDKAMKAYDALKGDLV